jgi:hypothetical protein
VTGERTRIGRGFYAVGAVVALWLVVPFIVLFVAVGSHGRAFTGAAFYDAVDQLQYMAWIRDAGQHGLVSNLFDIRPDPHLFLHPVFGLAGLLWKLGASIQLAFLVWEPLFAAAILVGFAVYVRRMIASPRAQVAALFLALFMLTPVTPLFAWLHLGSAADQFGALVMGLETFPGGYLSGAGAIAIGLLGPFLLGVERILVPAARRADRGLCWYSGWTAAAGIGVAWLHPWQGLTLLVILAGLVLWERHRAVAVRRLGPIALATAAPLVYYFALSHTDSAWHGVSQPNNFPHFGIWFYATMLPIAALALPGVRRERLDTAGRLLLLWPLAATVVYISLSSSWIYHSFAGVSLPLAILIVNGRRRLGVRTVLGALGVGLLTLPGIVFYLQKLHDEAAQHFLARDEASALRYLATAPGAGGVLAREPLGSAVPAFTGRQTWVGHPTWTPNAAVRASQADALFAGRLDPAAAAALVRQSGARFVLADCRTRADVAALLGPTLASATRFGCAVVYRVTR